MSTQKRTLWLSLLSVGLLLSVVAALGSGAVAIPASEVVRSLLQLVGLPVETNLSQQQQAVFHVIRLPRVLLAIMIGACLSVAGASVQGLFRNPLADPSLIGISAGAALSAAVGIVLMGGWLATLPLSGGITALSALTFLGALSTTVLVFYLSRSGNRTLVATMLLAGIAINAFAGAGTGLLTYAATDEQLRSLTFWTLGSLGGASWHSVSVMAPFAFVCTVALCLLYKPLNALALGEQEAAHIGTRTELVKKSVIVFAALGVGASVALAGIIGFIGLVVPHMLRLAAGPDHKFVLPGSAIGGALLLTLSDTIARTILAPAELPIGILTAMIGAPVFLTILLKDRKKLQLA